MSENSLFQTYLPPLWPGFGRSHYSAIDSDSDTFIEGEPWVLPTSSNTFRNVRMVIHDLQFKMSAYQHDNGRLAGHTLNAWLARRIYLPLEVYATGREGDEPIECNVVVIRVGRMVTPEWTDRRTSVCQRRGKRRVALTVVLIDVTGDSCGCCTDISANTAN